MYFDEFKHQLPDIDPDETEDWMQSLDQVVEQAGETRARFLVYKLLKRARQLQIGLPPLTQTRYINTISPEQEPDFPGDEAMELRIRRIVRWNAVAMVLRANTQFSGIGGHLSTYASSASLYETGFNHFFRGKDGEGSGDQIFYQGHAAPGIYARAFLEGRLTEDQLDHFRREGAPGVGLSSYPHPRLMPDFWEYPTVSMGLGPISAVYQARFNRYLHNRGQLDTSKSRVWAFLGDGETDEPESLGRAQPRGPRGPRQPDLRRQLQPAAARRPGPRQRQDHPGARGGLPRRGLERHQGHLGARVGRAPGTRRRRAARPADERDPRRRVPEVQRGRWRLHPRALLRAGPAATQARRAPDRRRPREAAPGRPRLPQGLRRVQGRDRVPGRTDRHPRQDREGLDPGRRASRPATSRTRPRSCPRRSCRSSATGCSCRSRTSSSRKRRTTTRAPSPRRSSTCASAARRSAAPSRSASSAPSRCPRRRPRSTRSSRPAARPRSRRPWSSRGSCAT